jgi:hypothetical protein
VAQIELLQPTEKIKDSYGKINTSLTNLNNNKLEKSGDTMNGEFTVDHPNNGGLARIRIKNNEQILDLTAYWEAGIAAYAQIQSWATAGNVPQLLRLNPLGGTVSINDYEAWHGGNNPASLATNGYQKLANGLILQWTKVTVQSGDIVIYPISFPNGSLPPLATADSPTPVQVSVSGASNTACFVHHENGSTPTDIVLIVVGW